MIFDGPDKFQESTVTYVRFNSYPLRERFAKLREQEFLCQDTLKKIEKKFEEWPQIVRKFKQSDWYSALRHLFLLEFTEAELMWMAHNVAPEFKDDDVEVLPKRRRKKTKSKESKESKQVCIWEIMNVEGFAKEGEVV